MFTFKVERVEAHKAAASELPEVAEATADGRNESTTPSTRRYEITIWACTLMLRLNVALYNAMLMEACTFETGRYGSMQTDRSELELTNQRLASAARTVSRHLVSPKREGTKGLCTYDAI